MKTKIFMKKEIKCVEIGKTLLIMILLTLMLSVIFIGEIGKMETRYGLNINGLFPLVKQLLASPSSMMELYTLVVNIGFALSLIVYSVYIGLPYTLSAYERSKSDGTLMHLMVMPIRVRSLVIKFVLFGFAKTVIMALFTYLLLSMPLFIIKPFIITKVSFLIIPLGISLISLLSILIVTCLLWIFNGSKAVITIFRWSILGLLIILMPLMKQIGFSFQVPKSIIYIIIAVLTLMASICFYLVEKYFDKEKILLSLAK